MLSCPACLDPGPSVASELSLHRELLLSMLGTLKSNLRETVRQQQQEHQSAAGAALSLGPTQLGSAPYTPADMAPPTEPYAFLA